ncbi:formate dehydrogenase accessory sulfurtransferase FdhD [Flavobacterium gilvum]|uniref:Sulfur carrier protein FdhD n=1 Tax=Flavobacterium gilvum TaxID=1492737 RepID=A0AAC9I7K8_9FLAO|nr:formate dehydrogenase accessory sulfurtransferase FdhD [Flavobacterium gilvum]AOW11325.1 formate dehydrogenase family accessory protein FdhD [Flavobacterium gilvum]
MDIKKHKGFFYNGDQISEVEDSIITEVALKIAVNSVPFTVTMQTPGNERDLVRGILFTEKIYQNSLPIGMEIKSRDKSGAITSINAVVPSHLVLKDFAGNRNVISSSSCGLCGKTELDDLGVANSKVSKKIDIRLLEKMFDEVYENQKVFKESGGSHAAGAFTIDGRLLKVQEDIGRHNAVDKVIGHLIQNNLMGEVACLTVSGRVSYEIISKAKEAGITFLASVSSPSSLAITTAEELGITLMGFCRKNKLTIYTNSNQVIQNSPLWIGDEVKN